MGALRRFEDKLEEMISGAFARTFRSAVQPIEIASALSREVDNSAQILSRDRRLAPNAFQVDLSQADYDRLTALGARLNQELVQGLQKHATEQAYVFTGPLQVEFGVSDELTTGMYRVRSHSVSAVSQAGAPVVTATDTQVRRAAAVLEVNNDRLPLSPPGILIGRGSDADLRIDDPGVSRRHVELRVDETPEGAVVTLFDLNSTNGVAVNGQRVTRATLDDGAVIRIGNTTMTLHQPRSAEGV